MVPYQTRMTINSEKNSDVGAETDSLWDRTKMRKMTHICKEEATSPVSGKGEEGPAQETQQEWEK